MTEYPALLNSIVEDNVAVFERMASPTALYNVCWGRFTMLSLCYFYRAGSILKKFEKAMWRVDPASYFTVEEPAFLYEDFKKIAGKCMRFYRNGARVEGADALAMMGAGERLTARLKEFPPSEQKAALLEKIYLLRYEQEAVVRPPELLLPKIKQPSVGKKPLLRIGSLFLVCALLFFALFAVCFSLLGKGGGETVRVYNAEQFAYALEKKENVILEKDLTLSQGFDALPQEVEIDGNGHTIIVESEYLVKKNEGKWKNVTFLYAYTGAVTQNTAIFVENAGVLEKVSAEITMRFTEDTTEDEIYLAGLVALNTGSILSCEVSVNAQGSSNGVGNLFLAGVCGENGGSIEKCIVREGSVLRTDTVDIAGVCAYNQGSIMDCVNYASIEQKSANILKTEEGKYSVWNPNCGGLTLTNDQDGVIRFCYNYGDVSVISTVDIPYETNEQNEQVPLASCEAFAAGIATVNVGQIEKCKNQARIHTQTDKAVAYTAGVVAFNTYAQPNAYTISRGLVNNCCSYGTISNTSTEEGNLMGGIVALNASAVYYSYSNCEYEYSQNEFNFIGGIIGVDTWSTQYNYFSGQYQLVYSSYVVRNFSIFCEDVPSAIAGIRYQTNTGWSYGLVQEDYFQQDRDGRYYIGNANYALEDMDTIQITGVYWE